MTRLLGYKKGISGRTAVHGFRLKDHPLYSMYRGMIGRCTWPSSSAYHRYGARGIGVCSRWQGPRGFVNFLADMGPRPTPGHQVDRVNNDGDYEPSNCRWATRAQQRANRGDSR